MMNTLRETVKIMINLISKLVDDRDPILKEVMPDFVFESGDTTAMHVATLLGEAMLAYNGIGLAAPQIGEHIRAFAVRTDPVMVCFNPRIVDVSQEEIVMDEGCLSFPGAILKINRARHIRMRYQNPLGETMTDKFTGMTARIILHELDHLNGIVFTDLVKPMARALAMKKVQKAKKVRNLRNKFNPNIKK